MSGPGHRPPGQAPGRGPAGPAGGPPSPVRAALERRFGSEMQAAIQAQQQGRLSDAVAGFRRALAVAPEHPAALNFLGYALHQSGDNEQALTLMERSVALAGGDPTLTGNLGKLHQALGDGAKAAACYQRALAANPRDLGLRFNLAMALEQQGAWDQAAEAYRQVAEHSPQDSRALTNLGNLEKRRGRLAEAEDCYRRALAINPGDPYALTNLGRALLFRHRYGEARRCFERTLAAAPNDATRLLGLAGLAAVDRAEDDHEQAFERLEQAVEIDPSHAAALTSLGQMMIERGQFEEARPLLERAIAAEPDQGAAYGYLAMVKPGGPDDETIATLTRLAADPATPPSHAADLYFALGKAHDETGAADQAFAAFVEANRLVRESLPYDHAAAERDHEAIMATLDPERLAGATLEADGTARPTPIFVIGLPRSGTSLVEQILASHPAVHGGGESIDILRLVQELAAGEPGAGPYRPEDPAWLGRLGEAYLAAMRRRVPEGAAMVTNKVPFNYRFAGLIPLALPGARIVHCRRDPRDSGLSCFMTHFALGSEFSYDLADFARAYRLYDRLMARCRALLPPGRMLELDYEALVADLEGQSRRLLDYCGLDWDPACLEFHRTERPVHTASAGQVRQPLYASAAGRWRRYEKELAPLIEALGELVPPD